MDREPYLSKPPWARHLEAFFYVAGYLLTGLAGVMAIVLIDEWPAREGGYALVGAGLLGVAGVTTRLYNLELIALWPILGGLGACILWLQLNDAQLTGWLVGALMPHFARRLLVLSLIARRARELHDMRGADGLV